MNSSASVSSATSALKSPSSVLCPPSSASQPIIPALALTLRARAAFPFEFLRIIATRLRAHLAWQTAQAAAVAAIDDDLEREFPLFVELLQNDPPKKRARALAILRATMRHTAARAHELNPTGAEHLLRD